MLVPVPDNMIEPLLDHVDGIVLSGGGDIEAHRYGGEDLESLYDTSFDRDEFEIELVRAVARRRTPTLAICRGMQVVNVALGGTLIQDIPTEIGSADHTVIGHAVFNGHQRVNLEEGSKVARVIGATQLEVNSIHHQAVRSLAPDLRAVGWAEDGVVEAIEHQDGDWPLLAVQWHPEYLIDDPASHALFVGLVEAARRQGG